MSDAPVSSQSVGLRFLEALGIKDAHVVSLTIHLEVDKAVLITVRRFADGRALMALADQIVEDQYELRKKETPP